MTRKSGSLISNKQSLVPEEQWWRKDISNDHYHSNQKYEIYNSTNGDDGGEDDVM